LCFCWLFYNTIKIHIQVILLQYTNNYLYSLLLLNSKIERMWRYTLPVTSQLWNFMSISFVNIKKISFFNKPYMVAGEGTSVNIITVCLLHDIPSVSYKRRLWLDEGNGNDRRTSWHTRVVSLKLNQNSMWKIPS
jgi:hypothetical protein